MSNELISILVLIAIFLIGTTMGINMGVLGIVAAFILGTALGVSEDDIFAGFPADLFVILVGVTSCPEERRDYVFKRLAMWGAAMVILAPPVAWLEFVVPGRL